MFDIGFWELAILFGLGLVVLGPERLPRVANQVGGWMGQARRMARQLTTQLRSELDLESINRPPPPVYRPPRAPEPVDTTDHGLDESPDNDAQPDPGQKSADAPAAAAEQTAQPARTGTNDDETVATVSDEAPIPDSVPKDRGS